MISRVQVLVLVVCALSSAVGCSRSAEPIVRAARGPAGPDVDLFSQDLARELEVAILENYLQLGLGNMEAYADSIARDRDVVLIGVRPGDTVTGVNPRRRTRDRRLFRDRAHCVAGISADQPCLRVLSKALGVHLSTDDAVGWAADEISYRVPHEEREAVIPLRMTTVMIRDIDRWVLVLEHISHALPMAEILDLARRGQLVTPAALTTRHDDEERARLLRRLALRRLNAGERARQRRIRAMERQHQRALEADDSMVVDEQSYLVLLPGPRQEYRGKDAHAAPSLARLFGRDARVRMDGYRLSVATNKRVAWMAATLTLRTPDPQARERELTIPLRGTFLFASDALGWHLVQTHVSVAVTEAQVRERFFGSKLPVDEPPGPARGDAAGTASR